MTRMLMAFRLTVNNYLPLHGAKTGATRPPQDVDSTDKFYDIMTDSQQQSAFSSAYWLCQGEQSLGVLNGE